MGSSSSSSEGSKRLETGSKFELFEDELDVELRGARGRPKSLFLVTVPKPRPLLTLLRRVLRFILGPFPPRVAVVVDVSVLSPDCKSTQVCAALCARLVCH